MKTKLRKHKGKIIVTLIIVVIAVIGVIIINVTGNKKKSSEKTVRESTISLSKMNLTKSVSATGTIESAKSRNISADVNGVKVAKVNVKVGDTVKKGDTLVTFDKSDNQDTLDDANDNLTSAKEDVAKNLKKANKQLNEAKETYSEQKEKLAKKVTEAKKELNNIKSKVSDIKKKIAKEKNTQKKTALNEQKTKLEEQLSQAKSAYEQAVENQENTNKQNKSSISNATDSVEDAESNGNKTVKEAKKQVKQAEKNVEGCTVKATMSGVVTALNVDEGDTYSGGTVATIEDTGSYTVTTSVDEYDISNVKVGQKVVILTETTDEDELEGEITFVAPTKNSSSGSSSNTGGMSSGSSTSSSDGYEVKIKINTSDERLKIGLTAKCSIILEEAADVYAVPYDAVSTSKDGNSYITVKENGKSKQIQVTKGMESDYYVEITGDDLSEGQQVVIPTDATSSKDDNKSDDKTDMFGGNIQGDMKKGGEPSGGGSGGIPPGNGGGR